MLISGERIMLTQLNDHSQTDDGHARRPASQPGSMAHQRGHDRRRFLARLREEVEILRALGLDHRRIAAFLNIEEHDVRAFCRKPNETAMHRNLPRRAIKALLRGRHASLGGKTITRRGRHLLEIAAAYTRDELLAEPGIGAAAVIEIELWLEERGLTLRESEGEHDRSSAPAPRRTACHAVAAT